MYREHNKTNYPYELKLKDKGKFYTIITSEDDNTSHHREFLLIPKDPKNTGTIVRDQGHGKYSIKWKQGGLQYNYSKDMLEIV